MLDAPRGFVVHAQVAFQLQGRHVGLGRRQQVDRQQPGAQRQLGRLEDRAAEQGRLMPTCAALVVHLPAAAKARAPAIVASRAAEAVRPARPVQGAVGLRFGAVLLHELDHRQALLELHEIDRHDDALGLGEGAIVTRRRRKSRDGGLRFGANQEVIYTKIYDERQTVDSKVGESFKFQIYGAGNTEEIASNIRDLYKEASDKDLLVYSQRIPNYERSRGVFKQQIRLSSNALVKVVETLQHYSFLDSTGDIKGRAFQKVLGPAIRAGMGQYFTPDEVVKLAVGIIRPDVKELILDPFCGSGHFLTTCLEHINKKHLAGEITDYSLHQFKFFHLHGIEKSERMVRIAMCDMALQDDGHTNIRCTDALLSFDNYPDIKALAGEENDDPQVFDIVLTNPPFGSLMGGEIGNIIKRFELGKNKKSAPLEILGLERCLQFLKLGGRMGIVLQDGVLTDSGHSHVREWLHTQAEVVAVVSLPDHTFTPYGASPKTSLLFLKKYTSGDKATSGKPVFFARLDDIGYDATGRSKGTSEASLIVEKFHELRGW